MNALRFNAFANEDNLHAGQVSRDAPFIRVLPVCLRTLDEVRVIWRCATAGAGLVVRRGSGVSLAAAARGSHEVNKRE